MRLSWETLSLALFTFKTNSNTNSYERPTDRRIFPRQPKHWLNATNSTDRQIFARITEILTSTPLNRPLNFRPTTVYRHKVVKVFDDLHKLMLLCFLYILCYYLLNFILREPERSNNPLRLNDQTGQSDQTILRVWTIVRFIVLILTFLIIYLPHDYTQFYALRKLAINATARTENLLTQSVFPLPLKYSYFLRTSRLHLYSTV